jgi:8-oxo-dGTP pyrophosphatase MutT (NUDIX family)
MGSGGAAQRARAASSQRRLTIPGSRASRHRETAEPDDARLLICLDDGILTKMSDLNSHVVPAVQGSPELRLSITANLSGHQREPMSLDGRRHAVVALVVITPVIHPRGDAPPVLRDSAHNLDAALAAPDIPVTIVGEPGGAAVLLTRRAARLRAHGGQWAIPGGRVETGEDPVAAARRELREEVGVDLPGSALMGALDDYATRSGYVITPYVFWGGSGQTIKPSADEVSSVHLITFNELCREDSPRFISIPESDRPVVQVAIGDGVIHAPTGAILLQFRRVAIEGTSERVAQYDQPVFAWR